MYGIGILRGMWVVFKHFVGTYVDDVRWLGRRYQNADVLKRRQGAKGRGIFTVQYPEERSFLTEEFRYFPFLIYEVVPDGTRAYRCTACGICAKVCPPQCIWIERAVDPQTGKPVPSPKEFTIDVDVCMSCGFCAEYCPFDAIKLDHDFEIATYARGDTHLWNKTKLSKPVTHFASIRPIGYGRDIADRTEKAAKKAAVASAPRNET
jgi:NADH-quinone oxidoreductase subunit I